MESVQAFKENMDKEFKKDRRRTYYGIALLLIVYGSLVLSYMFYVADYNFVNKTFFQDAYKTFLIN